MDKMCHIHNLLYKCLYAMVLVAVSACNTGIESTKTIKMTKEDRRLAADSPEEILAAGLRSQPLADWRKGKRFLVADNKASLVYERIPSDGKGAFADSLAGNIIAFEGVERRVTPGGSPVTVIRMRCGDGILSYDTGRGMDADSLLTGLDMPLLIDLDMVSLADSLLSGLEVWTNSRLWYDMHGDVIAGEKFRKVKITEVVPGNALFPLKVVFVGSAGRQASMFMNVAARRGQGNESRSFASLFMLDDPKLKYPSVSPEFWDLICRGKVTNGMTKDECRLSLGNPADVISGHDWDSLLDAWSYSDGSYLQFQDGLLVKYRN